jgi:hypothetical protein
MRLLSSERMWTWLAVHVWLGSVPLMVSLFVFTLTHGRTEQIAIGDSMLLALMLTATTMIDFSRIQVQGAARPILWSFLIMLVVASASLMLANSMTLSLQDPSTQFDRGVLRSVSLLLLVGAFVMACGIQTYITYKTPVGVHQNEES